MKIDTFHLRIKEKEISYKFSGVPLSSDLNNEMTGEEGYVVKILHKVLNLQLPLHTEAIMGRDDFLALGKKLSTILLPDDNIKGVLSQKFERAIDDPSYKCRIIIEFDRSAAAMAALPWEYLFFEPRNEYGNPFGSGEFLAADSKKCFNLLRKYSYEMPQGVANPPPEIHLPLNVLIVSANPDGSNYIKDLEQIVDEIGALQAQKPNQVQVKHIRQCSFSGFQQLLKDMMAGTNGQPAFLPHIIHFSGHGMLDRNGGKIAFVQEVKEDVYEEEWINDKDFADFFDELEHLPALIFLQICKGAKSDFQNNKGLALQLLAKKIPAVVALQNPVENWIAQEFVKLVYSDFLEGNDLGQAITEGRFQLARKLNIPDHEGNRKENYGDKAFGSPILFISTDVPISLYQEKEEAPAEEIPITIIDSEPVSNRSERAGVGRSPQAVSRQPDHSIKKEPISPTTPIVQPDEIIHAASVEVVEEPSASRAGSIQSPPELNEDLEHFLDEVENKLATNRFEEAIELMKIKLSRQSEARRTAVQNQGELDKLKRDERDGVSSSDEIARRYSIIRNALLKTLTIIKIRDLK